MNLLQSLTSAGKGIWDTLFGGKQQVVSPLSTSQDQTVGAGPAVYNQQQAGMYQPGFQGPVPQPQGTLPPPSGGGGGGGGGKQSGLDPHINPATGVWDDNYYAQTQGSNFADSILKAVADPLQAEIESWWKRLDEYDKNNPFAFDEALARASSQERLNPYYDATLNEFMTGVRRSSARSVEDMTRTIGELNVDASKLSEKERLSTQEAIRSSEEGFAGAGLFFSGKNQRATGLQEVQGQQTQEGIQTNLERGMASQTRGNTRLQEDLALQTARQNRLTLAERTTSIETDIAKQKREAELQRGLERLQFAGKIPGTSPANQLSLENQFYSGLT